MSYHFSSIRLAKIKEKQKQLRGRYKHFDKLGRSVSTSEAFVEGNLTMSSKTKNVHTFETEFYF